MLIDHSVPRWLITFLLMKFFGTPDLGALTPADKLWLPVYEVVKSLHNGFKNALMVDTSRSQWHVWLSLLLAMGTGRHHLGSIWTTVRQALGESEESEDSGSGKSRSQSLCCFKAGLTVPPYRKTRAVQCSVLNFIGHKRTPGGTGVA